MSRKFVVRGTQQPSQPPTELWLEEDRDGKVHLKCSNPVSKSEWYVLSIYPEGTVYLQRSLPSDLGFTLEANGRVILRDNF